MTIMTWNIMGRLHYIHKLRTTLIPFLGLNYVTRLSCGWCPPTTIFKWQKWLKLLQLSLLVQIPHLGSLVKQGWKFHTGWIFKSVGGYLFLHLNHYKIKDDFPLPPCLLNISWLTETIFLAEIQGTDTRIIIKNNLGWNTASKQ